MRRTQCGRLASIRNCLLDRWPGRRRGKRVFLATWREGKNFGDDYLAMALRRYLGTRFSGLQVVETNLHLDDHHPDRDDLLILGGGGLWGPSGTGRLEERLYAAWMRTKASLLVANLGIESLHESSAKQLKDIYNRSVLFSVRDEASWTIARDVLGTDRVLWGADNTYLSPLPVRRTPMVGCLGVNLCGPEMDGNAKAFSTESLVRVFRGLVKDGYTLRATVFTYAGSLSDYPYCRQIDPSCSETVALDVYRDCQVFIGMHFHSVLLALQNEVPVIALNYSDKVRRLMVEYGLERFCLEPGDPGLGEALRSLIPAVQTKTVADRIREGNRKAWDRLALFEKQLRPIVENSVGYTQWQEAQRREADWWRQWLGKHSDGNDNEWLDTVLARFSIDNPAQFSGQVLIDVGGGPIGLLTKLPGARRIVVDPQEIRSRDPSVERIVAMGENIPLPDRLGNAVFVYNVLQHVQIPSRVLAECVRILKPGGSIYILEQLYVPADEVHPHRLTEALFEAWRDENALEVRRWEVTRNESFTGPNRPGEAIINIRVVRQ